MVNLLEWKFAHDYTVFENKDNHKRIIKVFLKENISKIEKKMMDDYASKGELPTSENVHRIQDLVASILENFEIVDIYCSKFVSTTTAMKQWLFWNLILYLSTFYRYSVSY